MPRVQCNTRLQCFSFSNFCQTGRVSDTMPSPGRHIYAPVYSHTCETASRGIGTRPCCAGCYNLPHNISDFQPRAFIFFTGLDVYKDITRAFNLAFRKRKLIGRISSMECSYMVVIRKPQNSFSAVPCLCKSRRGSSGWITIHPGVSQNGRILKVRSLEKISRRCICKSDTGC